MPEITDDEDELRRVGAPGGGRWFTKQLLMFAAQQDTHKRTTGPRDSFLVAWDRPEEGAFKVYGLYQSAERFYEHLLLNDKRFGYEVIQEDAPCAAYFDVEWKGDVDAEHVLIKTLVKELRAYCLETGRDPEIYVSCGTRSVPQDAASGGGDAASGGGEVASGGAGGDVIFKTKNSYHVVVPNFIFPSSHCDLIKRFYMGLQSRVKKHILPHGLVWEHQDGTKMKDGAKVMKHVIDDKVYTRNRLLRLPLCSKRDGLPVPFLRISGDPFEDEIPKQWPADDADCVMPFVVSRRTADLPDDTTAFKSAAEDPKITPVKKTPAEPRAARGYASNNSKLPFDLDDVIKLLRAKGDTVSQVMPQHAMEDKNFRFQCQKGSAVRVCLHDNTKTHDSNNIVLFVKPSQQGFFWVSAQCFGCGKTVQLGHVPKKTNAARPTKASTRDPEPTPGPEPERSRSPPSRSSTPPAADEPLQEEPPTAAPPPINLEDPESNTYELVKERFETTCFRLKTPPGTFVRLMKNRHGIMMPTYISAALLPNVFSNLYYYQDAANGGCEPKLFIKKWLGDVHLKEIQQVIIDPENKHDPAVFYNMWPGFLVERIPPVDDAVVEFAITPIMKHVNDVIANGDEAHGSWLLDYLANIVQRPHQKTQMAIALFGKQGVGKGIIFEFFRLKLLGELVSYNTSNPVRDLFGDFANGFVNRVFVQIDEVKTMHSHQDALKDMITNNEIIYVAKGKDAVTVNNYTNLVFTSNNDKTFIVTGDERRFVFFQCGCMYRGNKVYFNDLAAHLAKPEVARGFYQHLMGRDLSAYVNDFQGNKPITEYYKEMVRSCIPLLSCFMSDLVVKIINKDCINQMPASDLYKRYVTYFEDSHAKAQDMMTLRNFAMAVVKFPGVTKVRDNKTRKYIIDAETIKEHLVDNQEFDGDDDA